MRQDDARVHEIYPHIETVVSAGAAWSATSTDGRSVWELAFGIIRELQDAWVSDLRKRHPWEARSETRAWFLEVVAFAEKHGVDDLAAAGRAGVAAVNRRAEVERKLDPGEF